MKLLSRLLGRRRPNAGGQAAAMRPYFYLGEGIALTRLKCGHFIYVDPLEESVCSHLIAHGEWEASTRRVVLGLVNAGDRVLEVGGHVGYYTLGLAQKVGSKGSVTTFEANPRLAALSRRSIRMNGYNDRVEIRQQAVTDVAGDIRFSVSRQFAGGGHLYVWDGALGADTEVIEVEGVRLDDLDLPDVKLIRIDAEGSEPLILRGAEKMLQRHDIILCIEWDLVQMRSRVQMDTFISWLADRDFLFWKITRSSELAPLTVADLATLPPCDLVVARKQPVLGVGKTR